ncbi:hypothetical protein KZJ38_29925 [Paraburkholderia edwinii]|jgi:hypothetical protein|uniref:Uncharacterized protein n=1 Tax=Paraburkholderia edwinii TaxID=2861782 RepID=A0ABX8UQJ8_9BURK|nr:hypothetical protein [Paraburkholderia edwinii]QYD71264.1 hypothetical protein KZJ38_29925 [Paraburkholderia edwinii]
MAKLVIKDLSASVELDRQAMTAIVGGARVGARFFGAAGENQPAASRTVARVVDFPPGFASTRHTVDERIPAQSLLRK